MDTDVKTVDGKRFPPVIDTGTFSGFLRFLLQELKPQGKILTPFNVISGIIIIVGLVMIVVRFAKGLASVTNLSQEYPWGLWIGFDVVTGVAFAGGAYVVTFAVHILGVKKYEPIVRVTVLNGFLAYVFYSGALLLDLGRPWNAINAVIGNEYGVGSVLFLVAWHFMLYTVCLFIEVCPAITEWLNWKRARRILHSLTTATVIIGITLSTLHQGGLGAMFLTAKSKIHPLWYSSNIGILFFISSIFAGFSMIIIESLFTRRVFSYQLDPTHHESHDRIILGLGKGAAATLFAYLFLKVVDLTHGHQWGMLTTPMGLWYLVEVIGFGLVPFALFVTAVKTQNVRLVQATAFVSALGVILNRMNVSVITFKWYEPVRYYPSLSEIWITVAILCMEIWVFRWVVKRMPILRNHPDYREGAGPGKDEEAIKWKASPS